MAPDDAIAARTVLAALIGVYDSGVGGLSVLRALRARMPDAAFVYVADSANAPYGDRDPDFLEARASAITRFMVRCGARALVLACNTVSVVATRSLRARYAIPIVAMEPAIKPAARATRSKVVLVLATETTIASSAVRRLCRLYASGVRVAVTGAGPGVFRWTDAETALSATFSAGAVAGLVLDDGDLNTDIHASAEFRAHLTGVMLAKAIAEAA